MKNIKKAFLIFFIIIFALFFSFQSQDIPISDLPQEISDLVNQYLYILQNSPTLEEAASKLGNIWENIKRYNGIFVKI